MAQIAAQQVAEKLLDGIVAGRLVCIKNFKDDVAVIEAGAVRHVRCPYLYSYQVIEPEPVKV